MSGAGGALATHARSPDLARAPELIAARALSLGSPLVLLDATASTNDDAKRGAREGAAHGSVWLAESQTAGRGRQGRAWLSLRDDNLLFSVLMRLSCAPARVPPVSLAVGLAVRDAVARAIGPTDGADDDVLVKWPNDVLVRSPHDGALRKIAGVLVESAVVGAKVDYVVIGIGINVLGRALPEEVTAIATSIALERDARGTPGAADRAEILADVLAGLGRDVELVAHKGLAAVHARLTRHDALVGREVESLDAASDGESVLRGVAAGVDVDGRLLVRGADGVVRKVSSGELRVRPTT
jgi:BirA family transcriptional regulator, biotin operon repressor / biotin---[acetyl-CoA-carboxylase] ligase